MRTEVPDKLLTIVNHEIEIGELSPTYHGY